MKAARSTLFLVILLFSGTSGYTQNVTYREIVDDPLTYKRVFVTLHLANMRVGNPNIFSFGGGAEFNLNKRFTFQFVADKIFNPELFSMVSDAVDKGAYSVEGGAIFNFSARIKKGNVVYHWKEPGTDYKLKVPGKVLRTVGLRGGIFAFGSAKELGIYKTYYNTQGIYAGIVFGATRVKEISAEGVKLRHTSKQTRGMFYIEGMYSPFVGYRDNTDYNSSDARSRNLVPGQVNLDTMVTRNHLGVRLGWQKNFRYPIPLQYGFELGARPGLQNNYYMLVRLAISIGFIEGKGSED